MGCVTFTPRRHVVCPLLPSVLLTNPPSRPPVTPWMSQPHARSSSLGNKVHGMAHHRNTSRHLPYVRNRLGSDAVTHELDETAYRRLNSDKSPSASDSPYAAAANDDDAYFSERAASPAKDYTPAVVENGTAYPPRASSVGQRPMLPPGADTPAASTTELGNPIATYPPPTPTWSNMLQNASGTG